MTFRPDINALRALSVLAVLFYHFGVPGLGGGFAGVDVFYVISGYLMTQIIVTKLDAGKFRLADFYAARARRILPGLAALVLVLLAFGYFYIPPVDYKLVGWQALSSLTFVSNIVLSHQGDYFDTAAREKWLLHTWTLSVEWQFYLLYPLLLAGIYRWKKSALKPALAALFIISLALSVIWTAIEPSSAFYLLPTRAWEMIAGAFAFLLGGRKAAARAGGAGLACILASFFFYTAALNFPGAWALLPVAGAVLVIMARPKTALIESRAVQFVGTISYSLYLWHWPVLVAVRYFEVPLTAATSVLAMLAAILLAAASYTFIEEPFRRAPRLGLPRLAGYALLPLAAAFIFYGEGLAARVPADVRAVTEKMDAPVAKRGRCGADYKKSSVPPDCVFGADAAPSAVLWGDSHANAIDSAVDTALRAQHRAALIYSNAGCPPLPGAIMATKHKKHQCDAINRVIFDKTAADPAIRDVFLTARWSLYLNGYNEKGGVQPYVTFDEATRADAATLPEREKQYSEALIRTACGLAAKGKRVHVVAPVPEMGRDVPAELAKSRLLWGRDAEITLSRRDYAARNAAVLAALTAAKKSCRIHIVNPASTLCDRHHCRGVAKGQPLYSDDNHLNIHGNMRITPLIRSALR